MIAGFNGERLAVLAEGRQQRLLERQIDGAFDHTVSSTGEVG
jgi:hypothetical protein